MFNSIFNLSHYQYNPHAMPILLAGVLIFLIGIFILLQTRKTVKNTAFFFFCMSLSIWLFPMGFVYLSNDPQTAITLYKHFVFLGVVNIMPNFYLFSTATAGFLNKQRPFVVAGYILSNAFYLLAITTDKVITGPNLFYWGYYPHYEPLTYVFFTVYALLFITSEVNLWKAYKQEEVPIKRTHIMTIFIGLLIGYLASFDFVAKITLIPLYPFGFVPSFILSAMVAYSVIKHKAFDIETVIHKTILWMLSFFIIMVPIFLMYRWALPWMKNSAALQMIFGLASFAAIAFYLRHIQPAIDHIFQRRRANLEETSNRFTDNLVHLKGLDNLVRYIEETIDNTMYSNWIDIFIVDEEKEKFILANKDPKKNRVSEFDQKNEFLEWLAKNSRIVYRDFVEIDPAYADIKGSANGYFHMTEATVAIPLVLNEQLLGMINLSRKANLHRYSPLDFDFLMTIKNQAAIAISNSLIYQNIEEQVKKRTEELVEVQKQLIQVEKLATVGTLSGGVAHEINNPLTAILTSVQMLLATCEGEDAQVDKESLELIEEATQRCRTIVQKLMTYAKKPMESGEVSKIDLSDVLEKVISFLGYQLKQEDITIVTKIEKGEYPVMGNHNELEQVLTNIILNARDAIVLNKRKGEIAIALSKKDDQIRVDIKDEGEGIPDDVISKIFDPFFTTKDVGKGLGLGLSICQSIVEKHKGQIAVRSEVGSETVFTVELPQYSKSTEPCNVLS